MWMMISIQVLFLLQFLHPKCQLDLLHLKRVWLKHVDFVSYWLRIDDVHGLFVFRQLDRGLKATEILYLTLERVIILYALYLVDLQISRYFVDFIYIIMLVFQLLNIAKILLLFCFQRVSNHLRLLNDLSRRWWLNLYYFCSLQRCQR